LIFSLPFDIKEMMNEVWSFQNIERKSLPPLRKIHLDSFQKNVLKNLHLEIAFGDEFVLFSPDFHAINLNTGKGKIEEIVASKVDVLEWLKNYLIENMIIYTAIIENNSYFIEQNSFLVIARLRERDKEGSFEVKYYSHDPSELSSYYKDKIYIGRDFVDLFKFERPHFGVECFIDSLRNQLKILSERADEKLRDKESYEDYFKELDELVDELEKKARRTIPSIPPFFDPENTDKKTLNEIQSRYRTLQHLLIEVRDELSEFEGRLRFDEENQFAKYVTKYKKDISNLILYLNLKIISRLTYKINFS